MSYVSLCLHSNGYHRGTNTYPRDDLIFGMAALLFQAFVLVYGRHHRG